MRKPFVPTIGAAASCRKRRAGAVSHAQIISLLQRVADAGFDFIKTENLYNFDGERGYSLDQGA